ncbi:uncharacterized protein LOC132606166 [Lycium barbarum]|uniref:uncharacterized protein LOC132606166 n=1 Tax=Lycium barbarum TaxID=112863 RepID=UPI00293E7671|nr:uncharacterized protein LOC132606166 [Lycium barbarum]
MRVGVIGSLLGTSLSSSLEIIKYVVTSTGVFVLYQKTKSTGFLLLQQNSLVHFMLLVDMMEAITWLQDGISRLHVLSECIKIFTKGRKCKASKKKLKHKERPTSCVIRSLLKMFLFIHVTIPCSLLLGVDQYNVLPSV